MELEKLYKECAKDQVRNFYKLHSDIFKSLAMDLDDLEQDIRIKIWETLEKTEGLTFEKGINNYIGGVVSNELRNYRVKALVDYGDITLQDFSVEGLNQTDEEILESLYQQFKSDNIKTADLNYNILYKKLHIGKTEEQIVNDLMREGIVKTITRHRVSDVFWKKIVPRYRIRGRGLKNYGLDQQAIINEDMYGTDDDRKARDYLKDGVGEFKEPSFLLSDVKDFLSNREYVILEKHFVEQKNFQQIADELNIRKTTAYLYYKSALVKLRKIIKKDS